MRLTRSLRFLSFLVATATAAPALANELVVWFGYRAEEKLAFEKVVANYNAMKGASGLHVTTLAVPFDAFADKITASVPRANGPDVFIYPQDRLGGWIETDKMIEPIDFFVDNATKERFIPTTMQAMVYRGSVYGLPFNYKLITLIYNKKLVQEPPKTTAELEALAKKLTNRSAGVYGLAYDYANYYYHAALQNGFGGHAFEQGTRPALNAPENLKAMDLLLKWKDEFLPAEPSSALITSLFNENKVAMVFSGQWFLGEIAKNVDYGLAVLPNISEANNQPMKPWMTVEGVYVAKPSKQKEAAYEFAKYITDVESAKIMAVEGRQTPANLKVYSDAKVGSDPMLKAFFKQVRVAVPMPNVPEMTMMWSPATAALGKITRRAATPQVALEGAQKSLEKDVASLRKKP
jgi:arabinogalactan oligomer/maltooligosaccharide transport system substrate-binding protein